jgi:hypothetical protein
LGKTTGGLAPSLRAGRPAAFNITGNVWAVVVERQNADGTWTKVAVFTDLNNTVVTGLVSGSMNTFRVCAMAAANQTSEWSASMSAICT